MVRELKTIAEHTVDLSLLTRDSKVLDLGCHKFGWAKEMLQYVDKVNCVDADDEVKSSDERLPLLNVAVGDQPGVAQYLKFGNGTGNFINYDKPLVGSFTVHDVFVWTIGGISKRFNIDYWDLIKFDVEGSEVPVIMSLTNAPAKQLSIEWHVHTGTPKRDINHCFWHLKELGYNKVFEDYSRKHGLPENYWDTLFINESI